MPYRSNVQRPMSKVQCPTSRRISSYDGLAVVLKILICLLILAFLTLSLRLGVSYGADLMQEKSSMLPACPDRPNCVSSLADQASRRVEPFPLKGAVSESLERLAEIIRSMPRTEIISTTGTMLKAEFRTRLGFVDDVLFMADEDGGVIHVRSASRVGSWDLGVNRRRVERIRQRYEASKN